MLAGGAEAAVIPSGVGGFIACRALSSRNEDPTKASRPWDKDRDGFVMGEGAGTRLSVRLSVHGHFCHSHGLLAERLTSCGWCTNVALLLVWKSTVWC